MKFYMAPLEGLTVYAYRTAYAACFGDVDKYFAPFISSNHNNKLTNREKNDILPEHNQGITLIPQLLSCNAEDFIHTAKEIRTYGYEEINLNLGCPSGTVTAKGKGAGFLADPWELDRFLDTIYQGLDMEISIKTRIGYADPEEFYDLLTIYNQYPVKELIVHPRTKKDFYNHTPNLDIFEVAVKESKNPVIYNGDINTKEDYEKLIQRFPTLEGVMCGRGILMHPGLIGSIQGKPPVSKQTLRRLHDMVLEAYKEIMSGDRNVMFRMKELWQYMGVDFEKNEKYLKKIRKTENLQKYEALIDAWFAEQKE